MESKCAESNLKPTIIVNTSAIGLFLYAIDFIFGMWYKLKYVNECKKCLKKEEKLFGQKNSFKFQKKLCTWYNFNITQKILVQLFFEIPKR